jgi:hypothetical protein
MQQWGAAGDHEARLFPARDDLDLKPDLITHPGEKRFAIGRAAAGFGCDVTPSRDFASSNLCRAHSERIEGARHGGIGERAGRGEPLAKPDDTGKGVDDTKARAYRPSYQQATIIRPEIKGSELASEPIRQGWRRVRSEKPFGGGALGPQRGDRTPDQSPAPECLLHGPANHPIELDQ